MDSLTPHSGRKPDSILSLKSLITLFLTMFLASVAVAETCVDGPWVTPPDNNIWGPLNGSFPVRDETEHFQLRYRDDMADISPEQAELALQGMERMYDWFVSEEVGFREPYCDSPDKYKIQIFAHENYGMSGSGINEIPAMWVPAGAIRVAAEGSIAGMAHEFTHSMQFSTEGLRGGSMPGWIWESHAEFMAHAFPESGNKTGCIEVGALQPHLAFAFTRVRYCSWMFWDYVSQQPDLGMKAVSNIWYQASGVEDQDPVALFKQANDLSQTDLQDLFGQYAMVNANWDYQYLDPDGTTRAQKYYDYLGRTDELSSHVFPSWGAGPQRPQMYLRRARMEAIDLTKRRFAVSEYFAPEIYGYNHVMLIPDDGATQVTVDFRGVVQDQVNDGAQLGVLDLEPGAQGSGDKYTVADDPASAWRWGIVAVDDNDVARYSDIQAGQSGLVTLPLQGDERAVFLVVAATPSEHHGLFWEQMYHTRYRYPYKIQVEGALPEGFEPGYRPEERFEAFGEGHFHPNGGGWVGDNATVDSTVFIGPNAAVMGGTVTGNARIQDYATVWSGQVEDSAVIGGLTQLNRDIRVSDYAEVYATVADGHTFETGYAHLGGTSKYYGDFSLTGLAEMGKISQGAFTGIVFSNRAVDPKYGADQTTIPTGVTAPYSLTWDWPEPTPDSDNDGVNDDEDAFPQDPTETHDSDGDGVGDNSDAFPDDATETHDTDSDGVGDNSDAFPDDANETHDSDGDGVGDNSDAFQNDASETVDSDGDGLGDNADPSPYNADQPRNLAASATLDTSHVSPWETLSAVNDGMTPADSSDNSNGAYGNWDGEENYGASNWVSFTWDEVQLISAVDVYWWQDGGGISAPQEAVIEYWNGGSWAYFTTIGTALNEYNRADIPPLLTTGIRVRMSGERSTGILEARVWENFVYDADGDGIADDADTFLHWPGDPAELAQAAQVDTSHVSPWETLGAVNDGLVPESSSDNRQGAYGNWKGEDAYGATEWVSLSWDSEYTVTALDVFWWQDGAGVLLPTSASVEYWNGSAWVELGNAGVDADEFNRLQFTPVTTTSIRVSMSGERATGILEIRAWGGAGSAADNNLGIAGKTDTDEAPSRTLESASNGATHNNAAASAGSSAGANSLLFMTLLSALLVWRRKALA